MTLAKTPSNGRLDPELTIFCNQARPQVEGLWHHPRHKTFNLQFVVPTEWTERLYPATDSSIYGVPQPSIRQSSRVLWRRWWKDRRNQGVVDIPQGHDPQNQLTWTHRVHWDQGACGDLTYVLRICYGWVPWCSCVIPNSGTLLAASGTLILLMGCLVLPWRNVMYLLLL